MKNEGLGWNLMEYPTKYVVILVVTVTRRGPHPKYSDSGTDVVRYEYLNTSIISGCLYLESLMMFARHVHIDSSFTLLEMIFSGTMIQ